MSAVVAPPNAVLTQTPTTADLQKYEGKHIKDICGNAYHNDSDNHCAHFVSHVLGFSFGLTCKGMTGKGTKGASLRVHELFAKCPEVGKLADCKAAACLVFITKAGNVNLAQKVMSNVPQKHVGVYVDGTIWHYSNGRRMVVSQTPEAFSKHYPGAGFALFYGVFPL